MLGSWNVRLQLMYVRHLLINVSMRGDRTAQNVSEAELSHMTHFADFQTATDPSAHLKLNFKQQ